MKVNSYNHVKSDNFTSGLDRLGVPVAWLLCGWLVACAAAAIVADGAAQAGPAYSLTDCIRIGLARSESIKRVRCDEEIARAIVREAGARAYPSLDVTAGYTRLDETASFELDDRVMELGSLDNYLVSAEFSQLLYSGGTVRAAIRAARLSQKYAEQSRVHLLGLLEREIRKGFHDLLLAEALVRVREESVAQLFRLVEQTELRYRHQTASEFEVLGAKVKLANDRPRLVGARNDLELLRTTFRNLINVANPDFHVMGELLFEPVKVDMAQVLGRALSVRPDIRKLQHLIGMLALDVVVARGEYKPTLQATVSYKGQNTYDPFASGTELEWHWNAGAVLSWPILDGGRRGGQVRRKALVLQKARLDLAELEKRVELEITTAYLRMQHAHETVAAARGAVETAGKGLVIAGTRLKNGVSTYVEYSDANLDLSTARIAHLEAVRQYLNAWADLRCAGAIGEERRSEGETE